MTSPLLHPQPHPLKPLKPGDAISLVAPASPFEMEKYERGCEVLRNAGYKLLPGRHVFERKNYLAGGDSERADDLISAFLDPDSAAVICIRGGYGSGRLLPRLPFSTLRKHPKIFLGHSDITFLHLALFSQLGWTTVHGPNVTGIGNGPEFAQNTLDALSGKSAFEWRFASKQVLREGSASGVLLGGNLTCMSHLLGTPYFPETAGAILLIEDCGEPLYRLDRIFFHLRLSGVLPGLGGIVLGDFENCGEAAKIHEMIAAQVKDYPIPVVSGLPFGHGARNEVVPLGAPFLLDTNARIFKNLRSPFAD